MENFKVAGIASGFDWASIVDQLMEIERFPQQRLKKEQTTNNETRNALQLLNTKLTTLSARSAELNSTSLFNAKSVALGNDAVGIKATAGTSATEGKYDINISKLATATKRMGTTDVGGSIGDANSLLSTLRLARPVTEGVFTLNGQEIAVAGTDSLQDVFDAISMATGGDVTATYDSVSDRISLASASGQLELGAATDTSNFLSAFKLRQLDVVASGSGSAVSSSGALGVVDLNSDIATSGLAGLSGAGTFYINGVGIAFDAESDSMSAVMKRVNESSANVVMTYDSVNDSFRVVNKETGAYAMSVIDSGNGLLASMGLTGAAELGDDLEFSVDGGPLMTSRSNSLSKDEHGIDGLTIAAGQTGLQTVTISKDTAELKAKIDGFISAFNDVQDYIGERTKVDSNGETVTAGLLARNREVSSVGSALRSLAFRSVEGVGGIARLADLGIDFQSGTSKLEIKDADKLDQALATNSATLQSFFVDAGPDSFSARMGDFIKNFTASKGVLDTQMSNLSTRNTSIDTQIAEMERRLTFKRSAMEASFIAMERAQQNINNQMASLVSMQGQLTG